MPTAPIYNGPQIAQGQAQFQGLNPNAIPAQMDGGLSNALGNAGKAAFAIYKEERDNADDIAAQDAIARAQNKQTERLYNPQTGVMFRKGADLYENARQFADDFQKDLDEIRDSLGNDRVKQRFQRVRDSLWNEYNRSLSMHVNREITETANTSFENFNESVSRGWLADLSQNPGDAIPRLEDGSLDFSTLDTKLELITGSAGTWGRTTKQDSHRVQKMVQERRGNLLVQTIKVLSERGDTAALKAIHERYGNEIPGDAQAAVVNVIKRGTEIDEAQQATDRIMRDVMPDPSMPTLDGKRSTLQEQESKANEKVKSLTGKLRDDVQARVTAEFNRMQAAERERQQNNFDSYGKRIQKGESIDAIRKEFTFGDMTFQQQKLLEATWEEKANGKDLGADLGKIYAYRRLAIAGSEEERTKFLTEDLTTKGFTPKEFKEITDLQIKLREEQLTEQKKAEIAGIRGVHEIAADAMKSQGWDDKTDGGRAKIYLFEKRLDEEVRAVEMRTKKKLVPADVQQISDELLLKTAKKGMFWGTNKDRYLFELSPSELNDPEAMIDINAIPEETRQTIEAKLTNARNGVAPSKMEIQREYFKFIKDRQETRGREIKLKK